MAHPSDNIKLHNEVGDKDVKTKVFYAGVLHDPDDIFPLEYDGHQITRCGDKENTP